MQRVKTSAPFVLVIDTSVLCVWMQVPGRESCGPSDDAWDHARVEKEIQSSIKAGACLVLPLTTLIETGNHIAGATSKRFELAKRLVELLNLAADGQSPWAAFGDQSELWKSENLKKLSDGWPSMAAKKLSLGDATIHEVARYYSKMGREVRLLTGDQELAALPVEKPSRIPRRRQAG